MAVKENAEQLKAQLQPQADAVKAQIDLLNQIESDYDADMAQAAADKQAFGDQRYLDGKASVVLPDPNDPTKIFSQAEVDQVAATARAETESKLQPQIDQAVAAQADLQAKLDQAGSDLAQAKQAQADAEAKLAAEDAKIAQAKADLG